MLKYSGAEAVCLYTDDAAVARAAAVEIKRSVLLRAVDLKLLKQPLAEVEMEMEMAAGAGGGGPHAGPRAIADKRLLRAVADARAMADAVTQVSEGGGGTRDPTVAGERSACVEETFCEDAVEAETLETMVLVFGPSWRNGREVIVLKVRCCVGGMVSAAPTSAPDHARAVKRLVATFWQTFFRLLSADNLAWLSRASTSRSYAMHALSSHAAPGWAPTCGGAHQFTPRQAVALVDVRITPKDGGRDTHATNEDLRIPPQVGQLFVVPTSVATP